MNFHTYRIIDKILLRRATTFFLQVQNRWQEQGIKSTRNRMISKRGKWVTTSCHNQAPALPRPVFWVIRCLRQSPQSNQMLARILQHKIQGIKKFWCRHQRHSQRRTRAQSTSSARWLNFCHKILVSAFWWLAVCSGNMYFLAVDLLIPLSYPLPHFLFSTLTFRAAKVVGVVLLIWFLCRFCCTTIGWAARHVYHNAKNKAKKNKNNS